MRGVLGINKRNLFYISYSKKTKRILDSKILTKALLKKNSFPVPETLFLFKKRKEILEFNPEILPPSFVIKPDRGFGGEGIMIIYGKSKKKNFFIKSGGEKISWKEIVFHILDILEGNFSLHFIPDICLIEERVKIIPEFKPFSVGGGIPDIRVVVYKKIPLMAMLRLPTKISKGKANLHQGGIGVGIEMSSGKTTFGFFQGKYIAFYPQTRYLISGLKIPFFRKILKLASEVAGIFSLKLCGVDISIDREKGPLILEVNSRPGLSIQLANKAGLEERIRRVEGLKVKSSEKAVRIAQELFGEEETEIEEIFGKKIIGPVEEVEIFSPDGKSSLKILAKIDTGAWRSSLCFSVAKKLGIKKENFIKEEFVLSSLGEEIRPIVPLKFSLKGEIIETEAFLAKREHLAYPMIVGRRDLKNFLIDVTKKR